jgi:[acyl-carrier-protein] S-malonyltransferase
MQTLPVILFPGQGSQYVGLAKDIYDYSIRVKELFHLAGDVSKLDIPKICFEGPQELLNQTNVSQLAVVLHSLSLLIAVQEKRGTRLEGCATTGLSVGEYSALAFAESISPEDTIRLVNIRATAMQEACNKTASGMTAIIGLKRQLVEEACKFASASGIVVGANYNSEDQIVISGDLKALVIASNKAKELGAKRAIELKVAGAFHSPLMEPAASRLREAIQSVNIKKPKIPVISNVTAQPYNTGEEIKETLVKQLTSPVRWHESMQYLISKNSRFFAEVGSGKVLSGMVRRMGADIKTVNLETLSDLDNFS